MIHIFELFAKNILKNFRCKHEITKAQTDYILIALQNNDILVQGERSFYRPSLTSRFYHN